MEYRSASPVGLAVWKVDDQFHKLDNVTLYNDAAPESPERGAYLKRRFSFRNPKRMATRSSYPSLLRNRR